jgi:hypothetical protein
MKKVSLPWMFHVLFFYGDSVGEVAKVLNENASLRQSLLNE